MHVKEILKGHYYGYLPMMRRTNSVRGGGSQRFYGMEKLNDDKERGTVLVSWRLVEGNDVSAVVGIWHGVVTQANDFADQKGWFVSGQRSNDDTLDKNWLARGKRLNVGMRLKGGVAKLQARSSDGVARTSDDGIARQQSQRGLNGGDWDDGHQERQSCDNGDQALLVLSLFSLPFLILFYS